ncbi:MAG: 4-hydroxythreonine-4-phosphate dehydrogenase PdxA [Bacteroidia bacterium]|nr:4-hydroxythreonine-4-phosphate dehydrogenase PdxA [Bacteroidia bacterium]
MESGSSAEKVRVGFSIGEAGGVGPQLLLCFLGGEGWQDVLIPIVFGHRKVIERWRTHLGLRTLRYHLIRSPAEAKPDQLNLIECGEAPDFSIGKPSVQAGALAQRALIQATEKAAAGEIDLLVTLPADKTTLYDEASFPYRGHTEYFRAVFSQFFPLMVMVSEGLRIAVATEHIPLREVAMALTSEGLRKAILTLRRSLQQDFAIPAPRIAVLGLNPHAGEDGLTGDEEKQLLKPLIRALWEEGILVGGPFSADGFFGSRRYTEVDAILALYHDQGLIPFKLLVGWEGFQFSAGLPFVRTSPDHGVAYEIAGQPEVELASLSAAIWEGIGIVRRRRAWEKAGMA